MIVGIILSITVVLALLGCVVYVIVIYVTGDDLVIRKLPKEEQARIYNERVEKLNEQHEMDLLVFNKQYKQPGMTEEKRKELEQKIKQENERKKQMFLEEFEQDKQEWERRKARARAERAEWEYKQRMKAIKEENEHDLNAYNNLRTQAIYTNDPKLKEIKNAEADAALARIISRNGGL